MFGFFSILVGLITLLVPVATIYLLISHQNLKQQVRELEERLRTKPDQPPLARAKEVEPAQEEPAPPVQEEQPPGPAEDPRPSAPPADDPQPPVEDPAPIAASVSDTTADTQSRPPAAIVFRAERLAALATWMRENWFFAIAGLSLALAGVFFVQYGIETGLLSPPARVGAAIALGCALIGAGEFVRRRGGDDDGDLTAFFPSTLAGAGLVSIWAGILAARQLYGLIGPETGFAGLLASAGLAVLLGWFYGPLLTAIGIIGAFAAPFLVGGSSDEVNWLYAYFGMITAAGLAIDAGRRWAWVSTLTLIAGFGAAWLLFMGTGGALWYMSFALVVVLAATIIPNWQLIPQHGGAMTVETLMSGGDGTVIWPEFPTRLVLGTVGVTAAVAVQVLGEGPEGLWIACGGLALLGLMTVVWMRPARALSDLAAIPVGAFLAVLVWAAISEVPGYIAYRDWVRPEPEVASPLTAIILLMGAVVASGLIGFRSLQGPPFAAAWTAGAALTAPIATILLELLWNPGRLHGDGNWALMVIGVAMLMTLLAERHGSVTEQRALRIALLVLSALCMISLSLFLVFSKDALTVALALTILAAALLDRRFDLPVLGIYVHVGVAVIMYRTVVDPGIVWALDAPVLQMLLGYGTPAAILAAAWVALGARERQRVQVILESTVGVLVTILVCILIDRALSGSDDHATVSLYATALVVSAMGQIYRLKAPGPLRWVRILLAVLLGLLAGLIYALVFTLLSPLIGFADDVAGPWLVNSLLVAYALPAAVFILAARYLTHIPRWLRGLFLVIGCAFAAFYVGLAIRHIWRGPDIRLPGMSDGELYTYTIALLLTSAALLGAAWVRRAPMLRRLAILAVGLTVAKVFLIDMSGLTGLIRVFSFLALGLSLAGLALVNRWLTNLLETPDKPLDEGEA